MADPALGSGQALHRFAAELFPLCRSITGDGVRETLRRMRDYVPLTVHEYPSGTPVFDWTIPKEWTVREAWIRTAAGDPVIDFKNHNLHVMSYSTPFQGTISREALDAHLHSLPDQPNLIPYRTSYYAEQWGFCLSHDERSRLPDGDFEVCIDSSLTDGALTLGELYLPGERTEEVLIYSHVCHPSLANDNLSGLVLTAGLASWLADQPRRLSYRFVWAPGTIGSIAWLAQNEAKLGAIKHGLVAVLLGDRGSFTYKRSRDGQQEIDRLVSALVADRGGNVLDFDPYGYDERQFCSPGINLAIGRLTRSPNSTYPEYHTSADNLEFITPDALQGSLDLLKEIVEGLEGNQRYVNLYGKGEPQLGKRGLYRKSGGEGLPDREYAMLWVLNQSDGCQSLLDISERSGIPLRVLAKVSDELVAADVIVPARDDNRAQLAKVVE